MNTHGTKHLHKSDEPGEMLGVQGRWTHRTTMPGRPVELWFKQRFITERRPIDGYGKGAAIQAELRFDDEMGNGHNTFAITAEITKPGKRDIEAGGCLHEDIARVFPEIAHLIRWHLCATDGPVHYLANTLYLAGDRDHNGLKAGEKRQKRNGRTGEPIWHLVALVDGEEIPAYKVPSYVRGENEPEAPTVYYAPAYTVGEGKERELDAARRAACWPEATDAELCTPRDELKAALEARLPALVAEFRADMERAGFMWSPKTCD